MESIELRIMGGLGNQLYQYASARYLQKKYKAKQLIIDNGEYDTYKIRNLEIDQLLHNDTVCINNIKSIKTAFRREAYHIYQKAYRMIIRKNPEQKIWGGKKEKYFCTYINTDLDVNLNCDKLHMYGYFVSAKIAKSMKESLMKELYLDEEKQGELFQKYLDRASCEPCIAVSIRCAEDYVKNNWPVCTCKYYCSGIDLIKNKKKVEQPIFIFADDIQKVKKEEWFSTYDNITYIEGLTVCESFELMRRCSDYVCSNSSFSWWGAFLSYEQDSIRINPNKVFSGDSKDIDNLTFYEGLTYLDYNTGDLLV